MITIISHDSFFVRCKHWYGCVYMLLLMLCPNDKRQQVASINIVLDGG